MRLKEFANAEEQLALWRVISDKVWGELKTLADQQMKAARAAAKQAAARPKRPTPAAAAPPPPAKPPKPAKPAKPGKPDQPGKSAALKRPSQTPSISGKLNKPPVATGSAGGVRTPLPSSQPTMPPLRSSAFSTPSGAPAAILPIT
ncbi:MAG: hypothetical protein EBZ84_10995 [Betaproteobacteria bacterium]|nr:hypothetical protein [Betaproteobacteria bacterium]